MIRKTLLNGLTLSCMLSLVILQADAGLFSWVTDYFNQPSRGSLVITTAVAGVSLLTAATSIYCWWKAKNALAQKSQSLREVTTGHDNLLKDKVYLTEGNDRLFKEKCIAIEKNTALTQQLAANTRLIDQLRDSLSVLENRRASEQANAVATSHANKQLTIEKELLSARVRDQQQRQTALEMENESLQAEQVLLLQKNRRLKLELSRALLSEDTIKSNALFIRTLRRPVTTIANAK